MSQVFTPATIGTPPVNKPTLFLGGSIEMGKAYPWQDAAIKEFEAEDFLILNPRRPSWNVHLDQSIDNPEFTHQVNWELDGINRADCVIMYFDENTKSPISMMELGFLAGKAYAGDMNKTIVYCRERFWRKGNVDIISARAHIPVFDGNVTEFFAEAKEMMLRNFERRSTFKRTA